MVEDRDFPVTADCACPPRQASAPAPEVHWHDATIHQVRVRRGMHSCQRRLVRLKHGKAAGGGGGEGARHRHVSLRRLYARARLAPVRGAAAELLARSSRLAAAQQN